MLSVYANIRRYNSTFLNHIHTNSNVLAQKELRDRHAPNLGVVLKIETKKGFQNLPWMLLQVWMIRYHDQLSFLQHQISSSDSN